VDCHSNSKSYKLKSLKTTNYLKLNETRMYQNDVKTTLFIDKFQERFDSSEQSCLSARLQNESVSGDKHAALTVSHKITTVTGTSSTRSIISRVTSFTPDTVFLALQYQITLYHKRTHFPTYTHCSENQNNTYGENQKICSLKFRSLR